MFEPRDISPDPAAKTSSSLDRLAENLTISDHVLFECTPSGTLIDANSSYFDIERGAGLAAGELATTLIAALAPGTESMAASFALELFGNTRHFHLRFALHGLPHHKQYNPTP